MDVRTTTTQHYITYQYIPTHQYIPTRTTHSTDTTPKHIFLFSSDTGSLYSMWHEACTRIPRNVSCMMRTCSPNEADTEIFSYIDEDISCIRDGFSAWVVCDPSATLERHLVTQTRISILSWNPGPRRGKAGPLRSTSQVNYRMRSSTFNTSAS